MLKYRLNHPEIVSALGRAGHSSKVLIADGNFPFSTKVNPNASIVYLNLSPGMIGAVDVLRAVASAIPIESALVMQPPTAGEFSVPLPSIWADFESIIQEDNDGLKLESVGRFNFYDACRSSDVALVVATGEQRIFANLLLTIGVIQSRIDE